MSERLLTVSHDFRGADILSADQFTRPALEGIFDLTEEIKRNPDRFDDALRGKIMSAVSFEPSTRSLPSFLAAMQCLGGGIIPINGMESTSVAKGETLEDTIRVLGGYSDVVVLRHPEVGAAKRAADATEEPVINAGDGIGEHPTQTLVDLFTIRRKLGEIDGKSITIVGDLKHGRTVHSLARGLTCFSDVIVNYVSSDNLKMPEDLVAELHDKGLTQSQMESLKEALAVSDVVYMTRIQAERFASQNEYIAESGRFVITPETMQFAKPNMALMHPLPRNDEIDKSVDDDPRAVYFDQAKFGKFVRMALLQSMLENRSVNRF